MAEQEIDMSIASIAKHTGLDHATARAAFEAMSEGQRLFNEAKRIDAKTVKLSRKSLYRLLALAAATLGMDQLQPKNLQ